MNISKIDVWIARAEAHALMAYAGADLLDAVDAVWRLAEECGLVAEVGPDDVQGHMSEIFSRHGLDIYAEADPPEDWAYCEYCDTHCPSPRFCECVEAEVPRNSPKSYSALPLPVLAASTIDAFKFLIRERDASRLQTWLARRSIPEQRELQRLFNIRAAA